MKANPDPEPPKDEVSPEFRKRYGLPAGAPKPKWGADLPVIDGASSVRHTGPDGKPRRVPPNN